MLNAKALSDLLSRNRDDRLCRCWFLMTPNGTLLAYSQPADINHLRKQAAIAAITWQERGNFEDGFSGEIREDTAPRKPLHTLTMERESSNVLIRRVQNQLLLVLEGGVPPNTHAVSGRKITTELEDGTRQQWPHDSDDNPVRSPAVETNGGSISAHVLKLQRTKLDAIAEAIIADFQQTGFEMPEEGTTTIF